MNALYNEYLTGAEREAAIIVAESDAQFAKLNILLESVDATLKANMLVAEAKVLAENGTYDDLTMLYKEATAEATEKKRGIIATIINAIGTLFSKIGNFLNSKFGKQLENLNNIPETVEVDKGLKTRFEFFKKAWDFLKAPIDKIKSGDASDIAAGWAQLVAEFGALGAAGATIAINRQEIITWFKTIKDDIQKKVQAAIATLKTALGIGKAVTNHQQQPESSEKQDNSQDVDANNAEKSGVVDKLIGSGEKVLSALQTFGGWISKWLGNIASAIGLSKNELKKEADAAETNNNQPTTTESASLLDIDSVSDDVLYESEMSDEEYTELCELFAEL